MQDASPTSFLTTTDGASWQWLKAIIAVYLQGSRKSLGMTDAILLTKKDMFGVFLSVA
jgi:hypothetical protein